MRQTLAMDAVREAVSRMPDDRLASVRRAALQKLVASGMPDTRQEDWKYTDLDPIVAISNSWLGESSATTDVAHASVVNAMQKFPADWLVIRNGVVDRDAMSGLQQTGVELGLLSDGTFTPVIDTALAGLNLALLRDGLTIRVKTRTQIERPIGLLFIDSTNVHIGVCQSRINIELEAGSKATFLEYHISDGQFEHYANTVLETSLDTGAYCEHVRIQDRHHTHVQTGRHRVSADEHSQFRYAAFDFGGKLVRNDLDIRLHGVGATATFDGLYLAGDSQHIDNHTRVDHLARATRSQQEYRGILSGNARCVWNGKAIVHAGADDADAAQANHNLLLSERAEVDAKPELEIYTDEVKAKHGATMGELDDRALFYLRTRGLSATEARQMLIGAFAQNIVALSPISTVRESIGAMVSARVAALVGGDSQ